MNSVPCRFTPVLSFKREVGNVKSVSATEISELQEDNKLPIEAVEVAGSVS